MRLLLRSQRGHYVELPHLSFGSLLLPESYKQLEGLIMCNVFCQLYSLQPLALNLCEVPEFQFRHQRHPEEFKAVDTLAINSGYT